MWEFFSQNRLMCVRASRACFPTGVHPSDLSLLSNQVLLLANPCLCFLCELGVNSLCEKGRAHPAAPPAVGGK